MSTINPWKGEVNKKLEYKDVPKDKKVDLQPPMVVTPNGYGFWIERHHLNKMFAHEFVDM